MVLKLKVYLKRDEVHYYFSPQDIQCFNTPTFSQAVLQGDHWGQVRHPFHSSLTTPWGTRTGSAETHVREACHCSVASHLTTGTFRK